MRITGWSIDGFGLFNDTHVTDLPEGLTVVYGPNESGKSTTLAFIRGVLFGFPKGRTKSRKYPPLRGGQHGGRLFLKSDAGVWIVERTAPPGGSLTVTLPDGSPGMEEHLAKLMAFVDREVFRNIFAFDLGDLDMRSLDSDAVKDRIFASTQTGAGVSPSQARQMLDGQMGSLLKPKAQGALINRLKSELLDVQRKMEEARRAAKAYPGAVATRDKLGAQVDECGREQRKVELELTRLEKFESLWPHWLEGSEAKEELAGIDAPDDVPEDILERLGKADAAIGEAKRAIADSQSDYADKQKRLDRIIIDDRLVDVELESEPLFAGVSGYEGNLTQLSDLRRETKAEENKVADTRARMGPGWDRERVASFDASLPAANEVARLSGRLRDAQTAQDEAARALRDAESRAAELRHDRSRVETQIADWGEVALNSEIDEQESQVNRLKALIVDLGAAEARVENAEQNAEQAKQMTDILSSMRAEPDVAASAVLMRKRLYGFAMLLAIASVVLAVTGQVPTTAVLGVAAAVAMVLGYLAGRPARSPAVVPAVPVPDVESPGSRLENRQQEVAEIKAEIGGLASTLDLPEAPTAQQAEECASMVARQREQRTELDRLRAEVGLVEDQEQKANDHAQDVQRELDSARAEVEAATREWDTWRTDKGIVESMDPDTVIALFQLVKECHQSIARLAHLEEQARDLRGTVGEFEERADDVLARAGEATGVRGSALAAALGVLHKNVQENQRLRVAKEGLETGMEGNVRQLERTEVELKEAEQRRADVLAEVSAADEAELRALVKRATQRRDLARVIGECTKRLDASLGLGASAEQMKAELSTGRVEEWQARRAEAEKRRTDLEEEKIQAVRDHQVAADEVERISESADVARLEIAAEGLRQEIAEAVRRWQVLALARALVDETVTLFEKKNQGPVVDRASSLFKKITADHYVRLLAHEGALDVEYDKGSRFGVESLSTGAAQQVYLCLRLGLAEEEARKRTSLPLIMDEVLVNFDVERALGAAEAIRDITERHQVLLFTCHHKTVELMRKTCGDVTVVELDRFTGTPH